MLAVWIRRLPVAPTYEMVILCCVPKACSTATFHCNVWGAPRFGSNAGRYPGLLGEGGTMGAGAGLAKGKLSGLRRIIDPKG
jgi:hypothetical protein